MAFLINFFQLASLAMLNETFSVIFKHCAVDCTVNVARFARSFQTTVKKDIFLKERCFSSRVVEVVVLVPSEVAMRQYSMELSTVARERGFFQKIGSIVLHNA